MAVVLGLSNIWGAVDIISRGVAPLPGPWFTPQTLMGILQALGLPVLLVISAWGCLKRKANARVALIVYCCCALGMIAMRMGVQAYEIIRFGFAVQPLSLLLYHLMRFAQEAVAPLLTLLLLTRPPIRQLFVRRAEAFEVVVGRGS
jgi:hypothetical protein